MPGPPLKLRVPPSGLPRNVIEFALVPVVCDNVILLPAHRIKPPDTVVLAPDVDPPPDAEISKLFTRFVGALIPMMLAPLLEIVIFGPADKVIVPVLEPPGAEMAFKPLTEMVIELAAVAVCKLIFAPAARAKDSAVPAILVPLALMVFVPIGCTVWEFALSWMTPAPFEDTVILTPLTVIEPELKEPAAPMLLTTFDGADCAGTLKLMVPPEALVLPVNDKAPSALRMREFPVNAVDDAVLPLKLIPVKFDVAEYEYETFDPVVNARPPPAEKVGPAIVTDALD